MSSPFSVVNTQYLYGASFTSGWNFAWTPQASSDFIFVAIPAGSTTSITPSAGTVLFNQYDAGSGMLALIIQANTVSSITFTVANPLAIAAEGYLIEYSCSLPGNTFNVYHVSSSQTGDAIASPPFIPAQDSMLFTAMGITGPVEQMMFVGDGFSLMSPASNYNVAYMANPPLDTSSYFSFKMPYPQIVNFFQIQQTIAIIAPPAPTLEFPLNASTPDVSDGLTFASVYNTVDGYDANAYALRLKVSGGTYLYWNAEINALQSTLVWNTLAVPVGPFQELSVALPSGLVAVGLTYNWSMATQESGANLQGPFANDATFTGAAPAAPTVSAPSGTVANVSQPQITWTDTFPAGTSQVAYSIVVESGGFENAPGAGTQAWASGSVYSQATSVECGAALQSGVLYRVFVAVSDNGTTFSPWGYSTFTPQFNAPATPTLVATPTTDPVTNAPVMQLEVYGNDNQLLSNQSVMSLGTTANWSSDSITYLGVSSQWSVSGNSLVLAASVSGNVSAVTPTGLSGVPVTPGQNIRAMAFFASPGTHPCGVVVTFYNSAGAVISTLSSPLVSTSPLVLVTTGGDGVQAFVSGVVPAGAVTASLEVLANSLAGPNGILATALAANVAVTSLSVTALHTALTSGESIDLVYNGNVMATVTTSAAVSFGALTIPIASFTPTQAFPVGTLVQPDFVYASQMLLAPNNFPNGSYGYDQYLASLSPAAWWKLNEPVSSATVSDSSGNGFSGTVQGATNLLTPPMDSFEGGVFPWTSQQSASIAVSSAFALSGSESMAVVSEGTIDFAAQTESLTVTPGEVMTFMASVYCPAGQPVKTVSLFVSDTSFFSLIGTPQLEVEGEWITLTASYTPPAGASGAYFGVFFLGPTNPAALSGTTPVVLGETHYVDCAGLFYGTNTVWVPGGDNAGVQFGKLGNLSGTPSDTSALFDGSTGYISASTPNLGTLLNSQSFSFSAIVEWNGQYCATGDTAIFSIGDSSTNGAFSVTFFQNQGSTLYMGFYGHSINTGFALVANTVYHIVVTYNASTLLMSLYVNGAYVMSATSSVAPSIPASPTAGIGWGPWATSLWSGTLQQVALYVGQGSVPLTPTQVLGLYQSASVASNPEYFYTASGFVGSTMVTVQFSDDNVNWFNVRNGSNLLLNSASQTATVNDYEGPLGFTRHYRAQVVGV